MFLFCFVFVRVQELCESRGGRPGISVLMSLTVSVDVKQHWTMLRHWSQFVLNTSTDIRGHEALHHYIVFWRQCSGRLKKQTNKTKQKPRRRWSNVITHNLTTVEHNSNPHIQYSNNCDSHYTISAAKVCCCWWWWLASLPQSLFWNFRVQTCAIHLKSMHLPNYAQNNSTHSDSYNGCPVTNTWNWYTILGLF